MAGTEYKARGRTVKKMTRNGLMDENLRDGFMKRASQRKGLDGGMRTSERRMLNRKASEQEKQEEVGLDETVSYDQRVNALSKDKKHQLYTEKEKESGPPVRAAPLRSNEKLEGGTEPQVSEKKQKIKMAEAAEKETSVDSSNRQEQDFPSVPERVSEHSIRMNSVKEHGSNGSFALGIAESRRKKKIVYDYSRKRDKQNKPKQETFFGNKEEAGENTRRGQVLQKKGKKKGRLSFDDEDGGMVGGKGMPLIKRGTSFTATAAAGALHGKLHEEEQDNAAVESVHKSELAAEQMAKSLRNAQVRSRKRPAYAYRLHESGQEEIAAGRLKFGLSETEKNRGTGQGIASVAAEKAKKERVNKFWQRKKYKKAYIAAKQGNQVKTETLKMTETVAVKAKRMVQEVVRRNKAIFSMAGIVALLFLLIAVSLGSCAAMTQGGSTTVISTTYAADDAEIYAAEDYYSGLEDALNAQINSMESIHPDYGDYQYQIDEISHNPYHLISYLTVKYGDFTFEQVKSELDAIFRQQYSISTQSQRETITETKSVRVGESLGQVVTSGYCNCVICCGQWSGGPTASGAMPQPSHTIAVDASNPFVPMGTKVIMNGTEYVVEDTGNFARYGVQFDVYYGDHASASAHGHQTWEAYIADDNGSQEVEVTSTQTVNRLNVTMTNHDLDSVLQSRMNEEERERYGYYNLTYGNRDYLFDLNTLPAGGDGFGYQIPAEALSDERFARMIGEAEKYLGYPYVWGGSSPATSFDCSGFVCWVINNCGNGWNVGRTDANGLRASCAYVSPSDAKPGDLIFFQGTYNTPGASHVGIYVGNNIMIHCGNPIKYTNIATSYWQEHFMAFGRLS